MSGCLNERMDELKREEIDQGEGEGEEDEGEEDEVEIEGKKKIEQPSQKKKNV